MFAQNDLAPRHGISSRNTNDYGYDRCLMLSMAAIACLF